MTSFLGGVASNQPKLKRALLFPVIRFNERARYDGYLVRNGLLKQTLYSAGHGNVTFEV